MKGFALLLGISAMYVMKHIGVRPRGCESVNYLVTTPGIPNDILCPVETAFPVFSLLPTQRIVQRRGASMPRIVINRGKPAFYWWTSEATNDD